MLNYLKNEKEQSKNLLSLMEFTKKKCFVYNSTKCNINTKFIKFFGRTCDKNGVHLDLNSPINESEQQYGLGIMIFIGHFTVGIFVTPT